MARPKRSVKGRKKTATKTVSRDPLLEELDTVKRLLMLQLVGSGVKPVDIAVILNVDKSIISGLIPVRRLLISKPPARKTVLDLDGAEIIKRLDTLIDWARKNKSKG